jgi:hypothetical protein
MVQSKLHQARMNVNLAYTLPAPNGIYMMHFTTIEKFFSASDFVIFFGLLFLYVGCGLLIFWVCNGKKLRGIAVKFNGIVPPFIGLPTSLFALTAALLGVSVWQNFQSHVDAVSAESRAISAFIQLNEAIPSLRDKGLIAEARAYARSAVEIEWPLIVSNHSRSSETEQYINSLLTKTAEVATQTEIPPVIAQTLMRSIQSISDTRNLRLELLNLRPDPIRWVCVLLLGLMVQLSVAAVHLDKPRPMALSLTLATLSITFILGLIGLSVQTHTGEVSISNEPLKNLMIQKAS